MHYTYRPINLDTHFDTYYAMYQVKYSNQGQATETVVE